MPTIQEQIDFHNAKLLHQDHASLSQEERATLRESLQKLGTANEARFTALAALPQPQAGSSSTATASRRNYDSGVQLIDNNHTAAILDIDATCPDWQQLRERFQNYSQAREQLSRLRDQVHQLETNATLRAARQLREDAARIEEEEDIAEGAEGARQDGQGLGQQQAQQRQRHQQQGQPQNQPQQQLPLPGGEPPEAGQAGAHPAAQEAERLAMALQADLPAAAPPAARAHLRPALEIDVIAPAKFARTISAGRTATYRSSNPLLQALASDCILAEAADKVPFLQDVASAMNISSLTSSQQRFRQHAETMARNQREQAQLLDKAALQVDDPHLRASIHEAAADAWRQTASVQATHLRLDKANSVLHNWKATVDIMTKGDEPEQNLVIGLANLSNDQRKNLLRSLTLDTGGAERNGNGDGGGAARNPGVRHANGAAAANANANRNPIGGAIGGCYFCRGEHGFRTCPDLNRLRNDNPQLHDNLIRDYNSRRPGPGGRQAA